MSENQINNLPVVCEPPKKRKMESVLSENEECEKKMRSVVEQTDRDAEKLNSVPENTEVIQQEPQEEEESLLVAEEFENNAQDWLTREEQIVLNCSANAQKRRTVIESTKDNKKHVDCYKRLYNTEVYVLSPSGSKVVELGLDPNNYFELVTRIRDKKTGITIDLNLEGLMRLIEDGKTLLNIDNEIDRVSGLFASGCTITKGDGLVYRIEQFYGLASRRFLQMHESSLVQLTKLQNLFLHKALSYDVIAPIYITLIRKYVAATRALIDSGDERVKANKFVALSDALTFLNKTSELEINFVCETYANFQNFFLSFFEEKNT